jgi:hypothetical protein
MHVHIPRVCGCPKIVSPMCWYMMLCTELATEQRSAMSILLLSDRNILLPATARGTCATQTPSYCGSGGSHNITVTAAVVVVAAAAVVRLCNLQTS